MDKRITKRAVLDVCENIRSHMDIITTFGDDNFCKNCMQLNCAFCYDIANETINLIIKAVKNI